MWGHSPCTSKSKFLSSVDRSAGQVSSTSRSHVCCWLWRTLKGIGPSFMFPLSGQLGGTLGQRSRGLWRMEATFLQLCPATTLSAKMGASKEKEWCIPSGWDLHRYLVDVDNADDLLSSCLPVMVMETTHNYLVRWAALGAGHTQHSPHNHPPRPRPHHSSYRHKVSTKSTTIYTKLDMEKKTFNATSYFHCG